MRRHNPEHQMDIPISLKVYHQLIGAAMSTGYEKEDWEIAAEAIDEWVRRHTPDAIPRLKATGYQWKNRFLPDGTVLRTVFGGKNYHCLVEGDRILYNGQAVSPSGFVNAVGGIRRNAWRCTWILFPDSKDWQLADTLRTRVRPRRVRTPAAELPPTPVAQSPASPAPVSVPPVAGPLPSPMECAAPSVGKAPDAQHVHDPAPRNNARGERRSRQPAGLPLSPQGFTSSPDRRLNADSHLGALLRQELLPLLYRMCAVNGKVP